MSDVALIPPDSYKEGADAWALLEKIDASSDHAQYVLMFAGAKLRRKISKAEIQSNLRSTKLENQLGGETSPDHQEMVQMLHMKSIPTNQYVRIAFSPSHTDSFVLEKQMSGEQKNDILCIHVGPSNPGFVNLMQRWSADFYSLQLQTSCIA